ncbi:MAG: LptF/LptG family permease [Thermosynechococcaceae cyanobacterium]
MTPHPLLISQNMGRQLWSWIPKLSVLDRYVVLELLKPFLFGVGIFSAVGVSAGSLFTLLQQVTATRIPLGIALQVLALQVPRFISLSLPMAMLLASLLCFSRLSGDRELTALRACGISFYRLLVPILIFGLCVTGLMFLFNEDIVPFTQYQAKLLIQQPLLEGKLNLQDKNVFYNEYGPYKEVRRFFYAQTFDGQTLKGLTILDLTQPKANQIISAEQAAWDQKESRWRFQNGKIYIVTTDGKDQSVASFEDQQLYVPRDPLDLAAPKQSLDEMSIADAQAYLAQRLQSSDLRGQLKAELYIQQQFAIPFITLIFSAIGSTLGTSLRRVSGSTGFGVSILIVLGYYFLVFLTNSLGNLGILSPMTSAWLPNLVTTGIAIWLLLRMER